MFQRTWEDPTFIHPDAEGCRGDNDPLDVCEIGLKVIQPGVRSKNLNDSSIFLQFGYLYTIMHGAYHLFDTTV